MGGARHILCHVDQVAAQSLLLDETMKAWIYQLDGEESEQIVDTAFGMIEKAEIHTVDDFTTVNGRKCRS